MELINRKLCDEINRLIAYYPVVTITGPRKSGKTTLCREMFPEFAYINLEDPVIRAQVIADPRLFFDLHPDGLIIDEIHNYPELFSSIQVVVDQYPDRRFVLTGSSNFIRELIT